MPDPYNIKRVPALPPGDYPDFRVEVRRIRSGQERRYGDSVWEAELRFSNYPRMTHGTISGTWEPTEPQVKLLAKVLVCSYSVDATGVKPIEWVGLGLDSRLEVCQRIAPQVWRVIVRQPYCD